MNGIRLETLMAAHEALMQVWHAPYTEPIDYRLQSKCLSVAADLKVALTNLGLMIEVKPTEPETEPLRAVA